MENKHKMPYNSDNYTCVKKFDFSFKLSTVQCLGGLLKVKSEFWIYWPKREVLIMKISGNQIKVAISASK